MPDLVHVKGLSDLEKFLKKLPEKMAANVVRGGLRAGAKIIQEEARRDVPVRSGALRNSLKIGTRRRGLQISANVKTKLFYARFVEFGTRAHEIAAKSGALFFGLFAQRVSHPGVSPKPFLRPALDGRAQAAIVEMAKYIRNRLATKHGLDTAYIKIGDDE